MEEKKNIQLSIVDIEKKYTVDPEEYSYSSSRYVSWGPDNNYPQLLFNCYNKSATLHAVINSRVDYILGDKIVVNESGAIWKEKVNRTGMTMRQLIAKLAFNKTLYGAFAIQVIYNKLGVPVELYPLDFGRIRLSEDKKKVYYSKKWTKYQGKADVYDAWDPKNIDVNNPTQIYVDNDILSQTIYPIPPYAGAIADVLTEVECSRYALNSVSKGFSAKFVLNFPEANSLTDEQKKDIEAGIKAKFCGSEADANFLLFWRNGDTDADKLEISKIESDETPERFIAVKDNARSNIFTSMRCSPLLCGLPMASAFSTDEFRDSYKLHQKTVIEPLQDIIREALDKVTGIQNVVTIQPFNIDFEDKEKEV